MFSEYDVCIEGHSAHVATDMALAFLEQAASLATFIASNSVLTLRLLLVLGRIQIVCTFLCS